MEQGEFTPQGLRVAIGLPSAVMLVIGGMVGVGVFVNPAVVARSLHSPSLVIIAWVLGGLVALLGAVVYAELSARLPATGGEYVYLRDTYGPLTAFLFGWTTLLVVQAGGMAAVAIIFAKNINLMIGHRAPDWAIVVAALGGLAVVNSLGVKSGNGVQGWLGLLKVVAIAALIAIGFFVAPAFHGVSAPKLQPSLHPSFLKAFGAGMIPVVFSYGGWQTAAYIAGEVKESHRNLGRALIIGVLCVIVIYVSVTVACIRVLGVDALAATLTPTSDVLQRVAGPTGAKLASAAIALSALAFISQGMLTGPRVYFAMARDGLFFRKIAEIAEGARVPTPAIIMQAIWCGVLALSGSYETILNYVTAMNFLFFGLCASALFVLRRRDRQAGARPSGYRAPAHPIPTLLFIAASVGVVLSAFWSSPKETLIGYVIMLAGVPPYLYWSRQKRRQEAAP